MSVSEFSSTLRNRISKSIKQKITRKNSQLKGFIGGETSAIKSLRTRIETANYNNIVLTKEGFNSIIRELGDKKLDFESYRQYMVFRRNSATIPKSLDELNIDISNSNNTISNKVSGIADPWTIIYNTPYDNLRKWTSEYLELSGVSKQDVKLLLGKFEAGHTLGLNTFRTAVSFGSDISVDSGRVIIRDEPDLQYFDRLTQLLADLDLAATNSIKTNTGIYTRAVKDFKARAQFYIEFQLKENEQGTGNQQTGKLLTGLGAALSKFAKASTANNVSLSKEFDTIVKNVESLEAQARKILNNFPEDLKETAIENLDSLLNLRGSSSLKQYIDKSIVNSLKGEKVSQESATYPLIKLTDIEDPILPVKKQVVALAKELKKANQKVKKILKKRKEAQNISLRTRAGQFTSLVSIQNLLNQRLHEQLKQNMRSPRLNYQTGRFAESVEVTNMSISRQGMITAFYTYMKYPYQTFEPGFAQGSAARDPKALIGKSIRDIASTLVGNRLRAVRV